MEERNPMIPPIGAWDFLVEPPQGDHLTFPVVAWTPPEGAYLASRKANDDSLLHTSALVENAIEGTKFSFMRRW